MRLISLCAAVVLALLATPATVGADSSPMLLKDINPSGSSNPSQMAAVGSTLFFAANDGVHGTELWKSNGTAAGTKMVKNIRPYGKSSDPQNLVNVNGKLFFTANDGIHGRELWKSDGTAAGTKMVKDLNTAPKGGYGGTDTLIHENGAFAIGNQLFFFVDWCCVGTSGLYVSDGTAAGTRRVAGVGDPAFELPETASVGTAGGKLYFVTLFNTGVVDNPYEYQLWFSDGTTGPGTRQVNGSPATDWENPISILPANGKKLYFYADGQLWRTNGTAAGTKALTAAGQLPTAPTESVLLNGRLYFNGNGLWKTDGTPSGTKMLSGGQVRWLAAAGNTLVFTRDAHLWKSDGTASGTKDMGDFGYLEPRMTVTVGKHVCFAEADWSNWVWTLWESDGTVAGTYSLETFRILGGGFSTGDGAIGTAVGSTLFFSGAFSSTGAELWSYTP
jgi:ELWxxDGT repeat protein